MNENKSTKGITLISLLATIIVLVILAGVTIVALQGENGILNKARTAKEENNRGTATEKINLKILSAQIKSYSEAQKMPTLQYLADSFCDDDEIQYVELTKQKLGSLKKISVGENKSIFTKLKEYPYEFEIDGSLKLASINGVKIADNGDNGDYVTKNDLDEAIAKAIASVQTTSTENPTGTVISYMGNNAPEGYLKCDGTVYNISEHTNLAEQIKREFGSYNYYGGDGTTTFAVPDLRGEFLRGTGTASRNTGTGAEVGIHQNPTYIPRVIADQDRIEYISAQTSNDGKGGPSGEDSRYYSAAARQYRLSNETFVWQSYSTTSSGSSTHYATRTTNTAVLYCIKD